MTSSVGPELYAAVPLRTARGGQPWTGAVVAYKAGGTTARVDVYGKTVIAHVPAALKGVKTGDQVTGDWAGGTVRITANNTRHPPPTYTTESSMGTTRSLTTQAPGAVSGSALPTVSGGTLGTISGSNLGYTNPFIPAQLGAVYFPGAYSPNDQTIVNYFNMIRTRMNELIAAVSAYRTALNTAVDRANSTLSVVNAAVPRVNTVQSNVNAVVPRVNSVHAQGNSMVSAVSNTQGVLSTVVGDLAVQEVTTRSVV